jgi:DNA-directed RNA polymerase subunit RPC12/RpoP
LLIAYLERADKSTNYATKLVPGIADGHDWNWWAKYGDEVIEELAEAFYQVLATTSVGQVSVPELQRLSALYAEDRGSKLLRIDSNINVVNQARSRVNTLVAQTIESGDSLGTLTRSLKSDFGFSSERARTIARTETATALGDGQKQVAKSEGRSQKKWVSQGDEGVSSLCELNAQQDWIPIDEAFISGDQTIPQHPNCRCTVIYRDTPIAEEGTSREGPLIQTSVRCPQCKRKNGENVAVGTQLRCRRCKHEWVVDGG